MKTDPLMQFFAWGHMPESLHNTGRWFSNIADHICANIPDNSERAACLRKLLEARDTAFRALAMK